MAAIREWFSVYGILFETMQKLGGEEGLVKYCNFLGGELHGMIGGRGKDALPAIAAYFSENLPKDGGTCTASLAEGRLTVDISLCPDHAYFAATPYEEHRFGSAYCESCAAVHRGLAKVAKCGFEAQNPTVHPDGHYSCRFVFATEETP